MRKGLKVSAGLLAAAALALTVATPAQALDYTWRANTPSVQGTLYSEPASANSIVRKGVFANVETSSTYFETTVYFGSLSSTGSASANINGNVNSYNKTAAKFKLRTSPNETTKIGFTIKLTGVPNLSRAASATPAIDVPDAVATAYEPGIDTESVEALGSSAGATYWAATALDGDKVLIAQTADGYTASTSIDSGLFQNAGLTLRVETPAGTIQGVVLPTGHNADAALTAAGLEKVSENFYVDTTDRVTSTTVTVAPTGKSGTASRGTVSGLQVALYGQPE